MPLCGGSQPAGPMTLFEQVTEGKKFFNNDMRCEYAGNQIVQRVDSGQITTKEAIEDCRAYARKIKGKGSDGHMLAWLCMHVALGLCHKFDMTDRKLIRGIMEEILPYSRGMDLGLFYRDINAFGDEGQYLDRSERDLLEKASYYLNIAGGFKVDLTKNNLGRTIYGATRATFPDKMWFLDLPIGNPSYTIGTVPPKLDSPLLTACENLKPYVVLRLLRHGASAQGEAMDYVLSSLSHVKTLEDATKTDVVANPVEVTRLCLNYMLRSVSHLKLRFDQQKIGDTDHAPDVYYVSDKVKQFLDEDYYAKPNKLKQLCRVAIRNILLENDKIPEGIVRLPKPLTGVQKKWIDLQA